MAHNLILGEHMTRHSANDFPSRRGKTHDRTRLTALLVSGDATYRLKCGEKLVRLGCELHTASEARSATDLLQKQAYDLVVVEGVNDWPATVLEMVKGQPLVLWVDGRGLDVGGAVYFSGDRESVLARLWVAVALAAGRTGGN